jgi:hypothetical protein
MRVLIFALALAGCAQQQYKETLAQTNERLKMEANEREAERQAECNRRGPPKIGMTKQQVFKTCWGETGRINRTQTANGLTEQYVYSDTSYLYFTNGILTAIQN